MIPGGLPPLNLNLKSSNDSTALGGTASMGFNSNAGTMNVNYGSGVSQGGAIPIAVWYLAIAVAGFMLWKNYK